MKITQVTPGLLPIPPNGWGAVEKIIWEYHLNSISVGHKSEIRYLNDVDKSSDIIHIHVANLALEAYERGIPYIFTLHDHHAYVHGRESHNYKENLEAIEKSIMSFVPAKFLIPYFNYHPKLHYLEHGVNTEFFKPIPEKPEFHKLLCVANNGFAHNQGFDRKGFSYAIQAAKIMNIPLTIVGPSNNKNFFENYRNEYDKLTILFDVNEEELLKVYREHTIFLHPSILEAGHPNLTLLEAMACGLPVVGTYEAAGNLPGLCRVERDVRQIINGITTVIKNYDMYVKTCLSTANDHSFKNITNKLIGFYESTINREISMKDQLIKIYEETPISNHPILNNKIQNTINYTFIKGAKVEILGDEPAQYFIEFINTDTGVCEYTTTINNNCWSETDKKYLINWHIKVYRDNMLISEHKFNPEGRNVYVSLESRAIGDTIAWMAPIEEFRKKHNANVTVSTFNNEWFRKSYPEIKFIEPGQVAHNIYAMFYIGWFYKGDAVDYNMVPIDFKQKPLQDTCTSILGLPHMEIKPKINITKTETNIKGKYVVIAPHASAHAKYWNAPGGWQAVIDHLNGLGYKVVMITQEKLGDPFHDVKIGEKLQNVIDKTGDLPMKDRMADILNADLFIGLGSGLSWVSWALGTKTIMISGFSEPYTEFSDCIRISNNNPRACTGCFNRHKLNAGDWDWCPDHKGTTRMFECSKMISPQQVISAVNQALL